MDNQRLFLYMALGFISLILYQTWLTDYAPRPVPQQQQTAPGSNGEQSTAPAPPQDLPAVPTQVEASTPGDVPSNAPSSTENQVAATSSRIQIETDLVSAIVDSTGGTIASVKLKKYPVSIDDQGTPFTLMSDEPSEFLIAQSGLQGGEGIEAPTHKAQYRSAETSYTLSGEGKVLKVPLVWEQGGVKVTKTLTFYNDKYEVDVDYAVENKSGSPWSVSQYYQLQRKQVSSDETSQFIRTYTGAVISTEEERYQKVDFGDIEDENLSVQTVDGWVAMIQHYFAGAWVPSPGSSNRFYTIYLQSVNRYIVGMNSNLVTVEDGGTGAFSAKAYIGPKVQDNLKAAAEHLELTVDYGWFTILAQPLFWLLKNIHSFLGNWGWAIVILTCLIKLFFYPLSQAGYKSMARMKKLQPKLQSLKERYGDDRAKMGQATMELYKKEKVNPLGGCFPMLVQIPVFIALYWMLLESVELRQAPWMFWIKDMAIKDPLYILPVIMGITMYIQQKLNPAPVDPIQAKVFMFLPLIFTVFFAFFPAGLVLYWIVNNTLSIAQQYYITRHVIGED